MLADTAVSWKLREILSGPMIHQDKPARLIIRVLVGFISDFVSQFFKEYFLPETSRNVVRSHDSATQPSLLLIPKNIVSFKYCSEFKSFLNVAKLVPLLVPLIKIIPKISFKTCPC